MYMEPGQFIYNLLLFSIKNINKESVNLNNILEIFDIQVFNPENSWLLIEKDKGKFNENLFRLKQLEKKVSKKIKYGMNFYSSFLYTYINKDKIDNILLYDYLIKEELDKILIDTSKNDDYKVKILELLIDFYSYENLFNDENLNKKIKNVLNDSNLLEKEFLLNKYLSMEEQFNLKKHIDINKILTNKKRL